MPPLTRSNLRHQQIIIAAVPAVAHILPQLQPGFEVDPMFKPRVKKRQKYADRDSRARGLGQEWSDSDSGDEDISELEDGALGEPSINMKRGSKGLNLTHCELKDRAGNITYVIYGSEEMNKAVAAKRAKRKSQERKRAIGRNKARRTWRNLNGRKWARDANGRWC